MSDCNDSNISFASSSLAKRIPLSVVTIGIYSISMISAIVDDQQAIIPKFIIILIK